MLVAQYSETKPTQTGIYREKYTFCIIKSLEHLNNLKTCRFPYIGLELTIYVIKSQFHLVRQSLEVPHSSENTATMATPSLVVFLLLFLIHG
jgi:hypothetical protein